MNNKIQGFLKYENNDYPFYYIDGILEIYPGTKELWSNQHQNLMNSLKSLQNFKVKHEWIGAKILEGTTKDGRHIKFKVSNLSSNDNGFLTYEVFSIYLVNSNFNEKDEIHGFIIKDDFINMLFDPIPTQEISFHNESEDIFESIKVAVSKKSSLKESCGSYIFNGKKINVEARAYSTILLKSTTPIVSKSELILEFSAPFTFNECLKIVDHVNTLLTLLTNRRDISILNVNVFYINENKKREKYGELFTTYDDEKAVFENGDKYIKINLLKDSIGKTLQSISESNLSIRHINKYEDRNTYDISTIINTFSAFEGEFLASYKNCNLRSDRYYKSKEIVINTLNELKLTQSSNKQKKDIQNFVTLIEKLNDSLKQQLKHAINDHFSIIQVFMICEYNNDFNKKQIDSITTRMTKLRNLIAHGDFTLKLQPIHVSDVKLLKLLIYVMILRRFGVSKSDTRQAVADIFNYRIKFNNDLD